MAARLERGEVLLTARIGKVLRELFLRVVPCDVTLGEEVGKAGTGKFGNFIRLAKGKDPLGIESDRKLGAQTRLDLGHRKSEALGNGFGNIKMNCHSSWPPANRSNPDATLRQNPQFVTPETMRSAGPRETQTEPPPTLLNGADSPVAGGDQSCFSKITMCCDGRVSTVRTCLSPTAFISFLSWSTDILCTSLIGILGSSLRYSTKTTHPPGFSA